MCAFIIAAEVDVQKGQTLIRLDWISLFVHIAQTHGNNAFTINDYDYFHAFIAIHISRLEQVLQM